MREAVRPVSGVVLATILLAAVSGCGKGLDARRAAMCRRAVPAIVAEGTTATILSIGPGPSADSIRVDYRLAGRPDASAKARWIVCGFGQESGLDSVATEAGPMSGASVYLLRHYYLDTPEAVAADPVGR